MAEYIKRETAVRAVMAAKWVDGSDGGHGNGDCCLASNC